MRIGTRGSALALAQAQTVASKLGAELVVIQSEGDRSHRVARLARRHRRLRGGAARRAAGRRGGCRRALAQGPADRAVPGPVDRGGAEARATPRDALCARDGLTLDALPAGRGVGTGSPRRRAQLLVAPLRPRGRRPARQRRHPARPGRSATASTRSAASTPSCSPPPGSTGSGASTRSPSTSASTAGRPRPRRARSPSRCAAGDEKSVAKVDHTPSRLTAEAERGGARAARGRLRGADRRARDPRRRTAVPRAPGSTARTAASS